MIPVSLPTIIYWASFYIQVPLNRGRQCCKHFPPSHPNLLTMTPTYLLPVTSSSLTTIHNNDSNPKTSSHPQNPLSIATSNLLFHPNIDFQPHQQIQGTLWVSTVALHRYHRGPQRPQRTFTVCIRLMQFFSTTTVVLCVVDI